MSGPPSSKTLLGKYKRKNQLKNLNIRKKALIRNPPRRRIGTIP